MLGGDRRTEGVEIDERSADVTDGEGEWEVESEATGGVGDGGLLLLSKWCLRWLAASKLGRRGRVQGSAYEEDMDNGSTLCGMELSSDWDFSSGDGGE